MIAENYFSDDADLKLIFDRLVDWSAVVPAYEGAEFFEHKQYAESGDERFALAPGSVEEALELYSSTLEALGEFWGKEVSQHSNELDKAGVSYGGDGKVNFDPQAIRLYETFRDTGLMPYAIPREAGGLGLPASMWAFYSMVMSRGDVSFCMTVNLLNLAQIVGRYGTPEQIERFAAPAAAGETLFAMALTEPDYGSDLSNVRTTATKQEDGSYVLNGTKRFITQGCGLGPYPSIMLTLARTGQPGARGLSTFLVNSKDVNVAGLEKKMGIHASPTCEIVFENTPGELIGTEGQGLTKFTIGMTNFMRLGCAAGGAGAGAGSLQESLKYAREREQFGKQIQEIPIVGEMLDTLRRETNAMRLFALETAYAVDKSQPEQIRLEKSGKTDREIRKNEDIRAWLSLSALFTSLSKYYCSEKGVECASIAVQIHGGAGYTEDYDVSRFFRDSRINTIYEGTSQLHIGIASGAIVAGMAADGFLRRYFESVWQEIDAQAPDFLRDMKAMLDEALPLYRDIPGGLRERYAQALVDLTARYMCSLLYERALVRLEQSGGAPDHWESDARAFQLDSAAQVGACLYRIRHATAARPAFEKKAAAAAG
ncbi:MAG: acyl-CoA dehydrogenase family protein [bacterium]|nr:acyl-CoA dehydrogenase family protein [bacterium]